MKSRSLKRVAAPAAVLLAGLGVVGGLVFAPAAIPVQSDQDFGGSSRILSLPQASGQDGGAGGQLLVRAGDGAAGAGGALTQRGGDATGGAGGALTQRGGAATTGNNVGGDVSITGGASAGSGAGSSVTLAPGAVSTGARGTVQAGHGGPDTDRVLQLATTGTNGAVVALYAGTRSPEGLVTGSPGDLYLSDSGTLGGLFLKSTGVATNTGWLGFAGTPPTPGEANSNSSVALSGVEQTLLSTNITLAANTTGRVESIASMTFSLGATLIGTNGGEFRIYVDGTLDPDATVQQQISATLAVAINLDGQEVTVYSVVTGLAAGTHTVQLRGVKLGAVSTATVNRRTLAVKQI